ncbi:MAG: UDP-N-acetylmuramoyl-L-alanine--D-glutamate ligase [Pseudomonadota bacterium]|jgi:UDP-N-acetylmuramoylalanine--D-glutamate ligase
MELKGKRVLVLGLGESGLAMAQWCARRGARVRVADSRNEPPYATELARSTPAAELVTGSFSSRLLEGIDLLGLSPGLALGEPVVRAAAARGIRVTGEIEMFAHGLNALGWRQGCRVLAITGTNGKTTVTSMAGAMGRAAGRATEVAGNISPAALTALMDCLDKGHKPELWVLELSSFQLETTESLAADAAVVLNVSDDHLDRYHGLDDYAAAKARIFVGGGVQVLNRQDARVCAMRLPGRPVRSFGLDRPPGREDLGLIERDGEPWLAEGDEALLPAAALPVAGRHNVANALAALALGRAIGLPAAPLVQALRDFRGLPHRVEPVAALDGVDYFDDSKGTNVGATVAALEGLGRKVVLIAGGDGKGQDFSPLKPALERHARALILIGRDATRIEAAVAGCGIPISHAQDMDQAVRKAAIAARRGDAVLLSPACASFDMYRNYAHRARVFVDAVHALARAREAQG